MEFWCLVVKLAASHKAEILRGRGLLILCYYISKISPFDVFLSIRLMGLCYYILLVFGLAELHKLRLLGFCYYISKTVSVRVSLN